MKRNGVENMGKTAGKGRKIVVGHREKTQGRLVVHPAGVSGKIEIYGLECHSNSMWDEADARPSSKQEEEQLETMEPGVDGKSAAGVEQEGWQEHWAAGEKRRHAAAQGQCPA